jgi:hypothetical protein
MVVCSSRYFSLTLNLPLGLDQQDSPEQGQEKEEQREPRLQLQFLVLSLFLRQVFLNWWNSPDFVDSPKLQS